MASIPIRRGAAWFETIIGALLTLMMGAAVLLMTEEDLLASRARGAGIFKAIDQAAGFWVIQLFFLALALLFLWLAVRGVRQLSGGENAAWLENGVLRVHPVFGGADIPLSSLERAWVSASQSRGALDLNLAWQDGRTGRKHKVKITGEAGRVDAFFAAMQQAHRDQAGR